MITEYKRRIALIQLLSMPDPSDMPERAHRRTYSGDAKRSEDIKRDLGIAYIQHRHYFIGLLPNPDYR